MQENISRRFILGYIMQATQISTGAWSIDSSELTSQFLDEENCQQLRLPDDLGRGHSKVFALDRDFSVIETHFAPNRDLAVVSRMADQEPRLVVTLGLKGHSGFNGKHGESLSFKEGYTSITTFNSSEGCRQYHGNREVMQLRFSVGKRWLESCFGEAALSKMFSRSAVQMVSQQPMSTTAIVGAQSLVKCRLPGPAHSLFRQGQAMTILASELSPLLADAKSVTKFGQRERNIAHAARDILAVEYRNPPSIAELSRRVGTNQCKLKQLFHHYFLTTPYGLLLQIRMQKAHELLSSAQGSVGSVAEWVGYSHASNFSIAFTRHFGFSPKKLSRQD